jgi:lysophospholipase L1-like esterase
MYKNICVVLIIWGALVPFWANSQTLNMPNNQVGALYNSQRLGNFYKSVLRGKPIHIIWLGDSHTASDYISGSTRDTLQITLGNAGRGFIDGGIPYKGFNPQHLQINTQPELKPLKSFPLNKSDGGPFGLGGYRVILSNQEKYSIVSEYEFDNLAICTKSSKTNPMINIAINDENISLNPQSNNQHITCKKIKARPNKTNNIAITIYTPNETEIASIGMWNDYSGLLLSSFGVSGATLLDLSARDDVSIKNQIAILPPSLIIIAYGTNEGFSDKFDATEYKTLLTNQIKRFKKFAPHSDIMLLLAPDANKATINRGDDTSCKTLPPELVAKYPQISHEKLGNGFYIPPNLAKVRQAQIDVANSTNTAYWDWHAAMGGDCSASHLSLLQEREIAGDRVHFTKIGGTKIGEKLANDIIEAIKINLRH